MRRRPERLRNRLRRAVAGGNDSGMCRFCVRNLALVVGLVLCAWVAVSCSKGLGIGPSGVGGIGAGGMGTGGSVVSDGTGGSATGGMSMGGGSGGGGLAGTDGGARIPENHRVSHETCVSGSQPTSPCVPSGVVSSLCSVSGDCRSGTNGRCLPELHPPVPGTYCLCAYDECLSDGDCSAGGACSCGKESSPFGKGNRCLLGDCQVDADCGPMGYCSPSRKPHTPLSWTSSNGALNGFYCHTNGDTCLNDADCIGGGNWGSYCAFDSTKSGWVCMPYMSD
jgi:hypothetical protein